MICHLFCWSLTNNLQIFRPCFVSTLTTDLFYLSIFFRTLLDFLVWLLRFARPGLAFFFETPLTMLNVQVLDREASVAVFLIIFLALPSGNCVVFLNQWHHCWEEPAKIRTLSSTNLRERQRVRSTNSCQGYRTDTSLIRTLHWAKRSAVGM